jgi:regulator of protease activity HflC (stomatin/prohibitin superfamily)
MNDWNDGDNLPRPPALPRQRPLPPLPSAAVVWPFVILFGMVFFALWFWYFCRIEPRSGEIAVLIRKTGTNLKSGQILALEPGQKGIQLEVLTEGRYFRNPYSWGWRIHPILDVPAGKFAVLTRLYGDELPPGRILAGKGQKGIVGEILTPGKTRVNPYAYSVQLFEATTIRPGHVGVKVSLLGEDVLDGKAPETMEKGFLVAPGSKGVIPEVLDPGSYYINPYQFNIVEVNLQSQRFEMSGADAISFLTLDGFTVMVEGTVEYAIGRDSAALLTHRVGDMEDIIKKVVLPRARGFSRIEGSKNPALSYIVGETRQMFQNNLEADLKKRCAEWGIVIKSVLIRNISPPDEIARIIREREVAVQNALKFVQQIEQAKSQAELTRQEMLALQNRAKVESDTLKIRAEIEANQKQSVALTAANRELEVARIENAAAQAQAQALLLAAGAKRDAMRMENDAKAAVLQAQARAFKDGMNYARFIWYQQLAPRIGTILSSDAPGGLGDVWKPLLPAVEGGK